jgi:hypothetical protein
MTAKCIRSGRAIAALIALAILPAAAPADERVLYSTSFEEAQPAPKASDYTLTARRSRTGKRSLTGAVDKKNTAASCGSRSKRLRANCCAYRIGYWASAERRLLCSSVRARA